MFPDVRITVFDAFAQTVLQLDAITSGDIGNNEVIKYEDTPTGNGAGQIPLALTFSEVVQRGYWRGYNIVEISTADNTMTAACASGATKIYVDSKAGFDTSLCPDTQQAYFWDGATLTMRVPVTGVGHDSGGDYITVGSPLAGGGNPVTLPGYGIGTYVGRRRYCGRIMRRSRPNEKNPLCVVTLVGFGTSGGPFDKAVATYTFTEYDPGEALYQAIYNTFNGRPGGQVLNISQSNFPTIERSYSTTLTANTALHATQFFVASTAGLAESDIVTIGTGASQEQLTIGDVSKTGLFFDTTTQAQFAHSNGDPVTLPAGDGFTGSLQNAQLSQMVNEILTAIPTGDIWVVRISHDRTPRLLKLYDAASNTYTYNKFLPQGTFYFEPLSVSVDDEDTSNIFNSIEIIGNTDPTTQQPVRAIVQDKQSINVLYGQIDATPVTVTGIQTVDDCAAYGQGLLNQSSLAVSNNKLRVFVRNDASNVTNQPAGLSNGDVVTGVDSVTVERFDDTGTVRNLVPDSEVQYGTGVDALWTAVNGGLSTNAGNGWKLAGTGSSFSNQSENSGVIDVGPGKTYTFSANIDASAASSGTVLYNLVSVQTSLVIAFLGKIAGTSGRSSVTFTVPTNTSQVYVQPDAGVAVVPTGSNVTWKQPQVEPGSSASPYVANYAEPNIYGLCASVVTTIDLHGDRYQDLKFAAVEPDWNAAMAERAHGLANAMRENRKTPTVVDSYCVSSNAFPYNGNNHLAIPTSGLTVNPPTFLALFAANSNILTVSNPTFTCQASSTNWAWLNPNLTWTVKQDPSPVSGSILYAIFNASATAIIGQTAKAPIGVMKIGLGNINVAPGLAAPTVTNNGSLTNVASTHPTQADIEVTVDLSGIPNDGGTFAVYFAFKEHSQSVWSVSGELDLVGRPPTTPQNLSYVYPQLANGKLYDFAVGYVALDGYGPFTQIGTPAQISSGFQAKTLLVTGPYLDDGALVTPAFTQIESTSLTANTLVGATSFPVASTTYLTVGMYVQIGSGGSADTLQIKTVGGSSISTTSGALNAHSNGDPVSVPYAANGISTNGLSADVAVAVKLTNQPTDGTLSLIHFWYRRTNSSNSGNWADAGAQTSVGTSASGTPSAIGRYVFAISDLVNGDKYDFGVSMMSNAGCDSAIAMVINGFTAQTINLGTGSLPAMPSDLVVTAIGSITSYSGINGGAYHDQYTVTPTLTSSIQPNPAVWMQGFEIFAKISTTKTRLTAAAGSGSSTFHVSSLTEISVGSCVVIYQANGSHSDQLVVQSINSGASTFTTTTNSANGYAIGDYVRSSDTDTTKSHYSRVGAVDKVGWSSGSISGYTSGLGAGNAYQLAVAPYDVQGNTGPLAIFAMGQTQYIGQGSTLDTPNLVHDSSFQFVKNWTKNSDGSYTASDAARASYNLNVPYWAFLGNLTLTESGGELVFGIIENRSNLGQDADNLKAANAVYLAPDGDRGTYYCVSSETIALKAGIEYCLSGYIDASTCAASSSHNPTGTPFWGIRDTSVAFNPYPGGNGLAAIVASAAQAFGVIGTVSTTFTPTADMNVVVMFCSHGCKVASSILVGAQPMLQVGSTPGPYQDGAVPRKGRRPKQDPNANDTQTNPSNGDGGYWTFGGFANPQNGVSFDTGGGGEHDHNSHSWQVKTAINTTGQGLLNEFPGGTLNAADGSMTNVSNVTSARQYTATAGQIIRAGAHLQHGTTTEDMDFAIGNFNNGYVVWVHHGGSSADNKLHLSTYVGGTRTDLEVSATTIPADLKPHHFRLTIDVLGTSSNEIEASYDNMTLAAVTDTSLDLTSGLWGATPYWGLL